MAEEHDIFRVALERPRPHRTRNRETTPQPVVLARLRLGRGGPRPHCAPRCLRHPTFPGAMLIYGRFALLVWRWYAVLVLAWVWLGLVSVNMVLKEGSMSRYPEWATYKKRTWWLLPGVL